MTVAPVRGDAVFHHYLPWTQEEWLALPDDGQRYEIVEGTLLVSPPPSLEHNIIASELQNLLMNTRPGREWAVTQNTGTVAGEGDSNLIPDLVVARFVAGTKVLDRGTYDLAVEVVSRSSRSYDRFVKPRLYAQAGVASFWRIEQDPLTVHVLRLDGDDYVETLVATGNDLVTVTEPWPMRFHVSDLMP